MPVIARPNHEAEEVIMKFAVFIFLSVHCSAADLASWYGHEHEGRTMANGQPFNPHAMVAASWFFPLGSKVVVTHGNRSVRVTVCDRGPHHCFVRQGRVIDLSEAAFARLAATRKGLITVKIRKEK